MQLIDATHCKVGQYFLIALSNTPGVTGTASGSYYQFEVAEEEARKRAASTGLPHLVVKVEKHFKTSSQVVEVTNGQQ